MSKINTFPTGGRGRKQCPTCKVYVGNRSKMCACGHTFAKKVEPKVETPAPVVQPKPELKVVSAPKKVEKPAPTITPEDEKRVMEYFKVQAIRFGDFPATVVWACGGTVKGVTVSDDLLKRATAECKPLVEQWCAEQRKGGKGVFVRAV